MMGHNSGGMLLDRAAELIGSADRAPAELDHASAPRVAQLVKMMTLALNDLDAERKATVADLKAQIAALEAPYKAATEALDTRKTAMLDRLRAHMETYDVQHVTSEFGPKAHWKSRESVEVVSPADVDRAYCSPDLQKIKGALKAGLPVAGVGVVTEHTVEVR